MAGSSGSLHEDPERLGADTIDRHRAIVSIMEELEAIDWYDQRVKAAHDDELRQILAHNRDEEKEHAAMTLEWLRRHDAKLDEHLRTYLFTDRPVLDIEHEAEAGAAAATQSPSPRSSGPASQSNGSLNIGSLRGEGQP